MIIETLPKDVINHARELLDTTNDYSSFASRSIVKTLLGSCHVCDTVPEIFVTQKRHNVNVIERYCKNCYEKQKKYIINKKRKRVKLG